MKYKTTETNPKTNLFVLRGHISYNGPDCCQIAVYCPFCRCNHYHGWPSRSTDPGQLEHRHCHCHDSPNRRRAKSPFNKHGYLIGIKPSTNNPLN